MRAAIYSPGPYLTKTMRFGFPISIAVNRAIKRVPLEHAPDWYCAGDIFAYSDEVRGDRYPKVGWSSSDPITEHRICRRHQDFEKIPHRAWSTCPIYQQFSPTYSITAAYLLAHALGATSIIVFGADQIVNGELAMNETFAMVEQYPIGRAYLEDQERLRFQTIANIPIERVLCPS
jgi:hypothetical protein